MARFLFVLGLAAAVGAQQTSPEFSAPEAQVQQELGTGGSSGCGRGRGARRWRDLRTGIRRGQYGDQGGGHTGHALPDRVGHEDAHGRRADVRARVEEHRRGRAGQPLCQWPAALCRGAHAPAAALAHRRAEWTSPTSSDRREKKGWRHIPAPGRRSPALPAAAGTRVLLLELGLRTGRPGAPGSGQETVRRRDAGAHIRSAGDAAHHVSTHRGDDVAARDRPPPRQRGRVFGGEATAERRTAVAGGHSLFERDGDGAIRNRSAERRQGGRKAGAAGRAAGHGSCRRREHSHHGRTVRPRPVPDGADVRPRRDDDGLYGAGDDRSRGRRGRRGAEQRRQRGADTDRPGAASRRRRAGCSPPAPPIASGGVVPDLQQYVGTYRNPRRFTVEVGAAAGWC